MAWARSRLHCGLGRRRCGQRRRSRSSCSGLRCGPWRWRTLTKRRRRRRIAGRNGRWLGGGHIGRETWQGSGDWAGPVRLASGLASGLISGLASGSASRLPRGLTSRLPRGLSGGLTRGLSGGLASWLPCGLSSGRYCRLHGWSSARGRRRLRGKGGRH